MWGWCQIMQNQDEFARKDTQPLAVGIGGEAPSSWCSERVNSPDLLILRTFKLLGLATLLAMPLWLSSDTGAQQTGTPADWVRLAHERLCAEADLTGTDAQQALPGSWLTLEERGPDPQDPLRISLRLVLPGADELAIERRQFDGRLRQFIVSYYLWDGAAPRPLLQATADGGCTLRAGRRLRHGPDGTVLLDQLDGDLETVRWTETLQAPWPDGRDPGGPRVALVDSGLAYDLEPFRDRLARDGNGQPLGYDFWDLDPLPFDGDMSRGPFLPIRHGTAVASILVREAPTAALIPYRYPRPDMSRLGALVARAAEAGARVIAVPLGSRRPSDWVEFEKAIQTHDMLAIVSAGNDGQNIDNRPVWPAALDLASMIVVTSADGFGRLAEGSNWGPQHVDVMLPAENVPVIDFRGASGRASGSSYAVPRLAALAVRILERSPELTASELRDAILRRATPSPYQRTPVVAHGWIPDPAAD